MKKIVLSVLLIMMGVSLSAQDAGAGMMQRIIQANQKVSTLQSTYTHLRTNAFGKVSKRVGNIYFIDSTSQLALVGSNPKGKDFIASEGYLHHTLSPITMNVNLSRSDLMRALTNNMLWAMRGEIQKILDDNTVDVTYATEGGYYVITMNTKKGFSRGISSIVLKYDTEHCLLRHMEMNEVVHVSHVFQIGHNVTLNHKVDPKVFDW